MLQFVSLYLLYKSKQNKSHVTLITLEFFSNLKKCKKSLNREHKEMEVLKIIIEIKPFYVFWTGKTESSIEIVPFSFILSALTRKDL